MIKTKKSHKGLYVLFILGMLVSLFLTYEHFSPSASKFCTFGSSFDCGIVNKSPYATLDGISYLMTIDFGWNIPLINLTQYGPVVELLVSNAFLGFLTLIFLFLLLRAYQHTKGFLWIPANKTLSWMQGILIFGVLYGFYLFLIQHFLLQTYCIFCIVLDIVLIVSLIIVWRMNHGKSK
ncbi:MAG: vitamin K epoxide reductase family protein [Candidatus Woesearchaeota archaeon]|nr:vitamin K epoxide reductase family protein [Candidatus Woesearchaeota archaeon]